MITPGPRFGPTRSKAEPEPQAQIEFHVDARHIGDDVGVGVVHAVIHLYTVDNADRARRRQESTGSRPDYRYFASSQW